MIDHKSVTKKEAKKILTLIEQWTRAEVMARLGPFKSLEYADYYRIQTEKKDEIRRLIYDTDNLVELGNRWGLLRKKLKKKKKKTR